MGYCGLVNIINKISTLYTYMLHDVACRISDKLVDELITEIAKELQMEDIIKKLFELEFQEF